MNGIGNAFIWAAIASGPFLLLLLAAMPVERAFRRPATARSAKDAHMQRRH